MAVRMIRGGYVAAIATVMTLALTGILPVQVSPSTAATVTPGWHTTASFRPVVNVRAVSCAPSTSPASATCVAVGDDGGHVASIIVTNNGGSTWADAAPPEGVTSLSAVSCPSATVCYAGGGSGIMKSTTGGSTWTVQDSTFPVQSVSCFTIIECTSVGGVEIEQTTDGNSWNPQNSSGWRQMSCPRFPVQMPLVASPLGQSTESHRLSERLRAARGQSLISHS